MKKQGLTRRLSAALSLVREGRVAVDVGTDHAYLPIALVESGKCNKVYASDINEGPLERAFLNISKNSLSDKIETVLCDGVSHFKDLADEIIICGMGGELIFEIIKRAPFLKSPHIHMVLQPMTKVPLLRKMLYDEGFYIDRETLVLDSGKIYTVMSVYYGGERKSLGDLESIVGRIDDALSDGNEKLLLKLLSHYTHDIDNRIYGKLEAGQTPDYERKLRFDIQKIIKEIKEKTDETL